MTVFLCVLVNRSARTLMKMSQICTRQYWLLIWKLSKRFGKLDKRIVCKRQKDKQLTSDLHCLGESIWQKPHREKLLPWDWPTMYTGGTAWMPCNSTILLCLWSTRNSDPFSAHISLACCHDALWVASKPARQREDHKSCEKLRMKYEDVLAYITTVVQYNGTISNYLIKTWAVGTWYNMSSIFHVTSILTTRLPSKCELRIWLLLCLSLLCSGHAHKKFAG